MKIYTLTIVYSPESREVYQVEEKIEDESMHYTISGVDLDDIIDEKRVLRKMQMGSGEVART